TTTLATGSGHARKCNDTEKAYCVNGGECYFIHGIDRLSCKRGLANFEIDPSSEWLQRPPFNVPPDARRRRRGDVRSPGGFLNDLRSVYLAASSQVSSV
ncbi:Pro-neuregulin-2, membrane-bound isoform, partial [Takifugu flavidus]